MKTDKYEAFTGSLLINEPFLPATNETTRVNSLRGQQERILINQPLGKAIQNAPGSVDNKTVLIRYVVNSYAEFFSGYCAACTSITLLFPLNKLIFRQMIGHSHSIKHAFVQIKSEGIRHLYRGMLPPLLQKSTSYSIMFGTQNEYYLMLKGKWN